MTYHRMMGNVTGQVSSATTWYWCFINLCFKTYTNKVLKCKLFAYFLYNYSFKDIACPGRLIISSSEQSSAKKIGEVKSEATVLCQDQWYKCPGVSHQEMEPISKQMLFYKISSSFLIISDTKVVISITKSPIPNFYKGKGLFYLSTNCLVLRKVVCW